MVEPRVVPPSPSEHHPEPSASMFETRELTKFFGGVCAVNNINLTIGEGEIVGLIGPNGAGKTTVFNLITGFIRPSSGLVMLNGENLVGKKPHAIAGRGIARTFQIAKSFPQFTVIQNMAAAGHLYGGAGFWEGIFRTSPYRSKERSIFDHSMKTLGFVGLEPWKEAVAGTLPHAHQKLLGVAMALATAPKLLLLDEPLEGMSAEEVDRTLEIIAGIRARGTTVLLIEHNMRAVMKICDRIVVINFGQEIARGTPEEVRQNEEVVKAYLGAAEYAG
jgi:branched-chain amino acid transport system ATP-binding protein